ncbi:hypothetical protein vseg_016687 [Gypsophila vaccaria]
MRIYRLLKEKNESFHVAMVKISADNSDGRYKFFETAKDLPTIMMSKESCLISAVMKCIAPLLPDESGVDRLVEIIKRNSPLS